MTIAGDDSSIDTGGAEARINWPAVAAAVTAAAVMLASAAAHAQTAPATTPAPVRLDDDLVTPRMMALGGRAEAVASSTSSIFSNPASVASTRAYNGDAYFSWDPTINGFSFGTAVIDSTRSFITGGVSYRYFTVDNPNDHRTGHDTRLALALPIGSFLGIGASVRYLNITGGPAMPSNSSLNSREWAGFTFDAGVFVRPVQFLQITASGRNLNNPDTSAAPIGVGFGAALLPAQVITIVADALLDFRMTGSPKGRYSGGVELFLFDHFALRAGYMYDDARVAHAITGGIGYLSTNFGAELSVRQGILPEMQTTLMLSARFFYQPPNNQ